MTYETEMLDAIQEVSRLERLADSMWDSHIHTKKDVIDLTRAVAKAQVLLVESRAIFDEAQRVAQEAQEQFTLKYKTYK